MISNKTCSKLNTECLVKEICSKGVRMKDCPELYQKGSGEMKWDVVHFLKQYRRKMNWKKYGDRSIDLGCADGSTTMILEKFLPSNYEELVGCDLNEKSVRFANEKYGNHRVTFRVLDIVGDLPTKVRGSFDHLFSFYAMHWVPNQLKAFQNVYDLLVEGGDCLMLVLGRHPAYTMFLALAKTERWAKYLKNVDKVVSPYYDCQEPDIKIYRMMKKIGFKQIDVKCKQMICVYDSVEKFKNMLRGVDPFEIPDELMEDFLADGEGVLRDLRLLHKNENGIESMKSPYNLLVIYGKK